MISCLAMPLPRKSRRTSTLAISKNGEASLQHQTHRELMDRPLLFNKRRQLFISAHDETLSIAVRVHNPNRSASAIQG